MKLNYSSKILILSAILFVGILALNVATMNLLLKEIDSVNYKIKQLEETAREIEKGLSLKDSLASSQLERERLTEYFVGAGNAAAVEFTEYLESLAKDAFVTQKKSLNYELIDGLQSSEYVSAIRFRFNVTGSWANVFSFLQTIENLPKVSNLNSVSLSINPEAVSAEGIKLTEKIWSADLDFTVANLKK